MPACEDADRFYYKKKALLHEDGGGAKARGAGGEKGKPLLFHWRGGYDKGEIVQEFLRIFKEEAAKKKIRAGFAELGAGDCEGVLYRTAADTGIDYGRSK